MKQSRVIILMALALLLAGCASTQVQTRVAEGFSQPVERFYLVAKVAGNWDEASTSMLEEALQAKLNPCVEMATHVISPLALDPDAYLGEMERFGTSHVLLLEQTMEKTLSQGWMGDSPRGFVFDARLVDLATEDVLWRANLDSGGNAGFRGEYIYSMAETLVEAMKKDGVIRCP